MSHDGKTNKGRLAVKPLVKEDAEQHEHVIQQEMTDNSSVNLCINRHITPASEFRINTYPIGCCHLRLSCRYLVESHIQ